MWCGPDDGDEPWTLGLSVGNRFAEASARGLDFLAITDHNDTSSAADPGFGSSGVLGVPGYENSVRGHAQVLGTDTVLDNGDESAAAMDALREPSSTRAAGSSRPTIPATARRRRTPTARAATGLHWEYGTAVDVDSVEVLNPTAPVSTAERFLDCLLAKGFTPAVTGGSDSHWASTVAVQGVGNPTTWVLSDDRTPAAILAAIRAGRTAVTKQSPRRAARRSSSSTTPTATARWQLAVGETVAPGTPLRVRSLARAAGFVTVRGTTRSPTSRSRPAGRSTFPAPPTATSARSCARRPRTDERRGLRHHRRADQHVREPTRRSSRSPRRSSSRYLKGLTPLSCGGWPSPSRSCSA